MPDLSAKNQAVPQQGVPQLDGAAADNLTILGMQKHLAQDGLPFDRH